MDDIKFEIRRLEIKNEILKILPIGEGFIDESIILLREMADEIEEEQEKQIKINDGDFEEDI